jgi:hypothetical protein
MGGGSNPVKKVVKAVTGAAKKIVKPITKAVSKVAKSVVKVGKKVVKGIKKGIKSVGKAFSKLGPLASIALMAIPGFQPFAAGLASSMGFTSQLAANMASGALTGFITSGGSLKGALTGGVMAGAGSYLGDVAKSAWNSGSLSTGFAQANAAAMAPNQFGVTSFSSGLDAAKAEWGTFTDKVGNFFSSQTPSGNIVDGAAATTSTFDKYGMSPTEYQSVYGKVPDTALSVTEGTFDNLTPQQAMDKFAAGDATQQMKMLAEQNAAFGADGAQDLFEMTKLKTPTEIAAGPLYGAPDIVKEQWNATMESMNINPNSEQAKMLAEQQFGEAMPDMTKTAGEWNYTPYDTSGDLAFTDWEDFSALSKSGEPGLPKEKSLFDFSKGAKALASMADSPTTQIPFVKSVSPIDMMKNQAGGTAGTAGLTGFTDIQRQTQASLLANIEQQQELARRRAAGGWGLA